MIACTHAKGAYVTTSDLIDVKSQASQTRPYSEMWTLWKAVSDALHKYDMCILL